LNGVDVGKAPMVPALIWRNFLRRPTYLSSRKRRVQQRRRQRSTSGAGQTTLPVHIHARYTYFSGDGILPLVVLRTSPFISPVHGGRCASAGESPLRTTRPKPLLVHVDWSISTIVEVCGTNRMLSIPPDGRVVPVESSTTTTTAWISSILGLDWLVKCGFILVQITYLREQTVREQLRQGDASVSERIFRCVRFSNLWTLPLRTGNLEPVAPEHLVAIEGPSKVHCNACGAFSGPPRCGDWLGGVGHRRAKV